MKRILLLLVIAGAVGAWFISAPRPAYDRAQW